MDLKTQQEYDEIIYNLTSKRFEEYYIFLKHILIVCSTILGVFLSLKKEKISDIYEFYSFVTVVSLLSICILIGVALQYGKVKHLDSQGNAVLKHRNKVLAGETSNATTVFVPYDKFFLTLAKIYVLVFSLSIISIVVYSLFSFY